MTVLSIPGTGKYTARHMPEEEQRWTPGFWVRQRRLAWITRKTEAARRRVAQRLALLGPDWRVLDIKEATGSDYLAIGPGGIFAVTVKDHGRARVMLAGEVVQVEGQRPPYVAMARRDASRISEAMSKVAGRRIPVIPVLAFLGAGEIVYYGKPPEGCVVASYRDLGRALDAHGNRLAQNTIDKLTALASRVDVGPLGAKG